MKIKSTDLWTADQYRLVHHAPGAPGLAFLGLGPDMVPTRGLQKLKKLLDCETFWACGRSHRDLRRGLSGSQTIVTVWFGKELIGFGRATSDGCFRAVLWDVVIAKNHQGQGLGALIVSEILKSKKVLNAEKVFAMTTNCADFYKRLGFRKSQHQNLMVLNQSRPKPSSN